MYIDRYIYIYVKKWTVSRMLSSSSNILAAQHQLNCWFYHADCLVYSPFVPWNIPLSSVFFLQMFVHQIPSSDLTPKRMPSVYLKCLPFCTRVYSASSTNSSGLRDFINLRFEWFNSLSFNHCSSMFILTGLPA